MDGTSRRRQARGGSRSRGGAIGVALDGSRVSRRVSDVSYSPSDGEGISDESVARRDETS